MERLLVAAVDGLRTVVTLAALLVSVAAFAFVFGTWRAFYDGVDDGAATG